MAKRASTGTPVYVDNFAVGGFVNATEFTANVKILDGTCLTDTGPRKFEDGYDHSGSHTGFLDPVEDGFDQFAFELIGTGTDHYVSRLVGGSAEGSVCYDSVVQFASQPRTAKIGSLLGLNLTEEGAGGLTRGLVLCNATLTGLGDRTGQNQGITTAGQTYAVVMRALSGTITSVTVKIQQSGDNAVGDPYADIAGLSHTFSTAEVVRLTTTAATEAWKRVSISAFTGANVVLLVTGGYVQGS